MASLQNVYIHVHSSFHFKKIFPHKICIGMAFLQNVCTYFKSTFHFKEIFSHNIYIWKASLQNTYTHVQSTFHFEKIFSHNIYIWKGSLQNKCIHSCTINLLSQHLHLKGFSSEYMHTLIYNQIATNCFPLLLVKVKLYIYFPYKINTVILYWM